MDLQVRFGCSPSDITKRTCIVIVEVQLEKNAKGWDSSWTWSIKSSTSPPPAFGAKIHSELILGIGKGQREFRDPAERRPRLLNG